MGALSIRGKVYLVGAGPGDPELMTVKAMMVLKLADTIIYDRLANREILKNAQKEAKLIFVGKEAGTHIFEQDEINRIIMKEARAGRVVLRLKGGDPFVLGRGGEEARYLKKMGVPFEVVPGVTSAIAVPEAAGIPITDRHRASSFTVLSGHRAGEKTGTGVDFSKLDADTLIILMGLSNLERIVEEISKKRVSKTPVAVIQEGTTKNEKVVIGTLENIVDKVKRKGLRPPAIIVVGEVVNLRKEIN